MTKALLENRVDFIKLFLENECSLLEFFNGELLMHLYNNVRKKKFFFYHILIIKKTNKF